MLFLLNDQIADVAIPEIHLSKRWKVLGCGDPAAMRAREALDFVSRVVAEHVREGVRLEETLVEDLAALIIAEASSPEPARRLLFGADAHEWASAKCQQLAAEIDASGARG